MTSEIPVKGLLTWLELFAAYRIDPVHGGQIITGRLRDDVDPRSDHVRRLLDEWPGAHDVRSAEDGWHVVLYRPTRSPGERWWLHAALLFLTLFSTMIAGGLLTGQRPLGFDWIPLFDDWVFPVPTALDLEALLAGTPFGLVLVAILALHESGHYVAARFHHIDVTPPFFIPFPPYVSIIGTLGAFIRLRSPVTNRRALLDVGVAGPLLSFVASIPALVWGLLRSPVFDAPPGAPGSYLVRFMGEQIWIGDSLAFSGIARLLLDLPADGGVVLIHPVAFAGWIGLFVTALNLLPISQLDGGHILYALLGDRQRPMAWLFFAVLLPLGYLWIGWWVWAALVFLVGRGRLRHPPVFNAGQGLDRTRTAIALLSMVIFIVCFVPVPFVL